MSASNAQPDLAVRACRGVQHQSGRARSAPATSRGRPRPPTPGAPRCGCSARAAQGQRSLTCREPVRSTRGRSPRTWRSAHDQRDEPGTPGHHGTEDDGRRGSRRAGDGPYIGNHCRLELVGERCGTCRRRGVTFDVRRGSDQAAQLSSGATGLRCARRPARHRVHGHAGHPTATVRRRGARRPARRHLPRS